MEFDPKQLKAIEGAVNFVRDNKESYRIGGYAGTGKTTIAKEIISQLENLDLQTRSAAFAGKAAHVLRKKGIHNAETIHRTIYAWDDHREIFIRKEDLGCDVLLVDEGSMVPIDLWSDLLSFHLPIIVIGDPGQLEPIGQDARLMHNPDIVLDTIHRYEGSIAWFANHVRQHSIIPMIHNDEVKVRAKNWFQSDWIHSQPNVILCGFNKTRIALNRWVRERYLRGRSRIHENEELICLHNDRNIGVFNGLTMKVLRIHAVKHECTIADVEFDDGRIKHELPLWHGHLDHEAAIDWRKYPKRQAIVDYGYAKTVHKFQGSEDKYVMVLDESSDGWDTTRWRYTAFTRASEKLDIYI